MTLSRSDNPPVNLCIAGHIRVDHRLGGPAVGSQFLRFAVGQVMVDVYVYGNYFALYFIYMLIILSGLCRFRFFEYSLVGCGQRFAGLCPESDPTADDNSGVYYIELLLFTRAPTPKLLGMDLINTLKTNVSIGHNDKS